MRGNPRGRIRTISAMLAAAMLLGACTGLPGGGGQPAGGAPGKPSGKPEVAAISVGTAAVIKDLLSPTLSYSGNVQARTQVNLVPKISARLEKLNADIGDEVTAGDVIAELDHAQLDAQVQQSEAAVTSAQAKLEQTQASAKPEDIAAAQAVVDQAIARLQQARAGGRPEEIAAARAAAEQAAVKAEQVARGARDEDRQGLQAAIDQAEAQQDQLRAQLTAAQTALSESRYRLEQARSGRGGPGVRPEDIATAQATLETNRIKVAQLKNPRPEDIRAAELEVQKAKEQLDAAEEARENCGRSSTTTTSRQRTTDPETGRPRTTESRTTSRQSCSEAQKDQLNAAIDVAQAEVRIKENALQKVKTPSPYDVQQAEQAVTLAEANLQKLRFGGTSDVATLDLNVSRSQAEVDRLQGALDQATSSIAAAQSKLDLAVNPDPREIAQATAAAQQARANLARIANPDPYVVQQQAAQLDQAQAQLDSRIRPFTEQDIRVAAAAVDQAAAALEISKVQAAESIIRAPFNAVVSQKLMSPGAMASPNTPILGLVSKDVEVVVQVEEARMGQVQRGQAATLSVGAYPGRSIPAIVAAVAPSADARSRTFAVRVVPSQQDGTLRDGMFAQVSITGVGQPSILVPNAAIVTRAGRSQVFAINQDRAQAREVRLGETDGIYTAVVDGRVNVGDQVVVTNPDALTDGAPVAVDQRDLDPKTLPAPRPPASGPSSSSGAGAPGGSADSKPDGRTGGAAGAQGGQAGGQGR